MPVTYSIKTAAFDSELGAQPDPKDNATTLTVVLRLEVTAIDARTAQDLDGKIFRAKAWSDGEVRQYLADFKKTVQDCWSNQFFIMFPDPGNPLEAMSAVDFQRFVHPLQKEKKPYLTCNLLIRFTDKNGHARVNILNLVPGQGRFHGRITRAPGSPDTVTLGNDAVTVFTQQFGPRDEYSQIPAAHEVGHLLGLDHVNAKHPQCKIDKNAEICYGGTPYERNDIMGVGWAVTGDHAKTWLKAIALHTGHEKGWTASHLSPPLEEMMSDDMRRLQPAGVR